LLTASTRLSSPPRRRPDACSRDSHDGSVTNP
jgi:hypothetical protein